MSPPKKARERSHATTQPPMANMRGPAATNPSAAALARKYPDVQQMKASKAVVLDENLQPPRAQDRSRLMSGFSHAGRVPTPHPFIVPQARMNQWDSDVSMRDTSSRHSTQLR